MFGLDPVEDRRVVGTLAQVIGETVSKQAGATLCHYAAVHRLAETGRLISEIRFDEPERIPWILTTCRPFTQDGEPVQLAPSSEQFKRWFTDSLRPVGDARWTEEGLTLVYKPGRVTDAVTFCHDGRLEAFTRVPVVESTFTDGYDLLAKRLEARIVYAALISHDWYESLNVNEPICIDVSLVSMRNVGLLLGRGGFRRPGVFTRDYIHLSHRWGYDPTAKKHGLAPLCDRLWQAGGMPGSQVEIADDSSE